MQDQELKQTSVTGEEVVDNTDYITALKELKQNSVSKDKYDALVEEKKRLLEAVVNGQEISNSEEDELEPRIVYYEKYKKNDFPTDLEYWTNLINLRKATIKEYGADPCVTGNYGLTPEGGRVEPAYGEPELVQEQFEIIEDMIKQSKGNSQVFERLLQSSLPRK